MPREMPEPPEKKPQDYIDIANTVAMTVAGPFLPFLRSHCGSHAFYKLWPTAVYIPIYAAFANAPEIIYWFQPWLIALIFRRLTHDRNQDSNYRGWPWISGLFCRRERTARIIEALLLLGAGYWLEGPLGNFLMIGAAGLFVTLQVDAMVVSARQRIINDARIRSEQMARLQRGEDVW
jgi:hypothetical protein